MKLQIFVFIFKFLFQLAQTACIDNTRTPMIFGTIPPCPMYNDQPVCCRNNDIEKMISNYRAIDATFGSDGGGCDMYQKHNCSCGANLKRFWCIYTCDQNQTQFINYTGRANVTDPQNKNKLIDVQLVQLNVTPTMACEVYSSCSRTSFVRQVSAMQTPGGFFMFQGEQAINQGAQFITFEFQEGNSLAMENTWSCEHQSNITTIDDQGKTHYWDQYGYELKEPCGCNTCESSCSADHILYTPTGVLYGFQGTYVIFAWIGAILFALGITICRNYNRNSQKRTNSKIEVGLIAALHD